MEGNEERRECVICGRVDGEELSKLYEKGKNSLLDSCQRREDCLVESKLRSDMDLFVHPSCRRRYTDKRFLNDDGCDVEVKKRRSRESFDWDSQCFICGESADFDAKHPERKQVFMVRTLDLKESLLSKCDEDRPWSEEVRERLLACHDLVSPNARYHVQCLKGFTRPLRPATQNQTGRPTDDMRQAAFNELCEWLENEIEARSVEEVHGKLCELTDPDCEAYGERWLREKLKDRYKDHIFFAQVGGQRKDVICFRDIISRSHASNPRDDPVKFVEMAGKLVRDEIRTRTYSKEFYPNVTDLEEIQTCRDFLTPLLQILLKSMTGDLNLKSVSVGHAITQIVKPHSVLSPLLFGLGVQMDNQFGSRWLIDQLHACGFCISYDEMGRFKNSIMQQSTIESIQTGGMTQFVADNADANTYTLDGSGTFHGLGIVSIQRRGDGPAPERVRRLARLNVSGFREKKIIPLLNYVASGPPAFRSYEFKPFNELVRPHIIDQTIYLANCLWSCSHFIGSAATDWLNWSGFMTHIFTGHDQIMEDHITILPLIDLNPNDESTLFSCLSFVSNQTRRLNIKETSLTFDQPLYHKSQGIVKTEKMENIVVRMGPFHMLISATGSVFHPMKGSGVEEALNCIYGADTVTQMMTGKAIARASRALHLLQAALMHHLLLKADLATDLISDVASLLDDVHDANVDSLDAIMSSVPMNRLMAEIETVKQRLSVSRTAKLWIQFIHHIETVHQFVACERLKNWEGHLNVLPSLLAMFAGTGHMHYAKSGRIYLQEMRELPTQHPDLYYLYLNHGMHAVQRTSHAFNGLSTDLIIEQVLMRTMKTRGGLTRGRGLTESVRLQWVYAMPMMVGVQNAMADLTGNQNSSTVHADLRKARRMRDTNDLRKLVQWFKDNDPFDEEVTDLRSLSSGLIAVANDGINCDNVDSVGLAIQQSLDHITVSDAKIKRKSIVKTLNDLKPAVHVGQKAFRIEPVTLFLRCTSIAQRMDEELEPYFEYELNLTPPALFDGAFMRRAKKSDLAQALTADLAVGSIETTTSPSCTITVIDGGWMLNFKRWHKGIQWSSVIDGYVKFVQLYGPSVVVFDGYESSTKDHEHSKRLSSAKKVGNRISISLTAAAPDQSQFLANINNKEDLIRLVAQHLQMAGFATKICSSDADTTIVSTALTHAREGSSVRVVANDTDIMVMLVHHWDNSFADVSIQQRSSKRISEISLRDIVASIGPVVKEHILFIHSWSGCDTTSATYGQGKLGIMKKLIASEKVQSLSKTISDTQSTAHDVAMAGRSLFASIYGGCDQTNLSGIRLIKFRQMMTQDNSVKIALLPPSSSAAGLHAMRVHLQIEDWKFRPLDPLDWGWELRDERYTPIPMELPPAPESVVNYIRCKCKSLKNPCGSNLCSCRKHGLRCVDVCGGCHGENCSNSYKVDLDEA